MYLNAYLELNSTINQDELTKIKKTKNLYIKIFESDLDIWAERLKLSVDFLTVEIIQNSKELRIEGLENFIFNNKPNRIIVTIKDNYKDYLIEYLDRVCFPNLAIDFYTSKPSSLKQTLTDLLTKYSNINHFSIYPNKDPLFLEQEFLGFKRYHQNMWSKDPDKYYAYYDFQTIKDKQYLGIGNNTVTRNGYSFYKNNKEIKLSKSYIDLQDHIDRLNYCFPLSKEELEGYPLINKQEYLNSSLDIQTKHLELISNLLKL